MISSDGKKRKVCTACEEHAKLDGKCVNLFVCSTCSRTLSVCESLPGGLDATGTECNSCLSRRNLVELRELARIVRMFKLQA